jgi:amidase
MAFKFPTPDDVQLVGKELGLSLSKENSAVMCELMTPLLGGFDYIDEQPDELPRVKYPDRDWAFPETGENPLGGWYVRTSIKGATSGPLAGRTVAIKDNIFVAGVPMVNGAAILEGFVPDFDATVVTRLLDAGAEITGKAACECLCVSGASFTACSGLVKNSLNPDFSSGGSSSGSAAVVAGGEADMALGCDQAGSVRCPSSWSGLYGIKATFGIIPYTGAMGQEVSLDNIGPMTSNVSDNALMLEVLAGRDGYDDSRQTELVLHRYTEALGRDVRGMKIAVVGEGFGQPQSETLVDDCVRAAASKFVNLGAKVDTVSIPVHAFGVAIWAGILGDGLWQTLKMSGQGYNHIGVYSPALCDAMGQWVTRLGDTPANVQLLSLMGQYLERFHGRYYFKAKNLARRLKAAYDALLSDYDLLLMPTTRTKAQRNPESLSVLTPREVFRHALVGIENTCPFNVTGHPAMSIPCGIREGLPVGMMLIGRHFGECEIYRAAHAFEQAFDWRSL